MPEYEKGMFFIGAKVITVEYEHTGELGKTPSQLSGARLIMFLYYSPQKQWFNISKKAPQGLSACIHSSFWDNNINTASWICFFSPQVLIVLM